MTSPMGGVPPIAGAPTPTAGGPGSASAAAARVAELQALIVKVESGDGDSSSFGAQLASASAGQGGTATAAASSLGAGAAETAPLGAAAPLDTASPTAATGFGGSTLPASTPYAAQIEAAASRNGIDPALLAGLIKAESGFDPNAGSSAGAQGLTQLMPETARSLGVANPLDPEQAIEGGARLLSEHLKTFGGNTELALAAYNAGPGAVRQYNGIPPYPETQAYVQKVLGYAAEFGGGLGR
jgi:soluble lytic murein transglycosylase-like protein